MAERIVAELKAVQVVWSGTNKNEKTGKQTPVIQVASKSDDGRMSMLYVQGNEELKRIAVGEVLNLVCSMRAWKDAIYLFAVSWMKPEEVKKPVRV